MNLEKRIAIWPLVFVLAAPPLAPAAENATVTIDVQSVVVNLIAEVELAAEEAGPLVELAVTEGKRVKAGDFLGRLDDRDAVLTIARAEIALKHSQQLAASKVKLLQAQEARELAKLELERATTANQELARVVSESQLAKLRLELRRRARRAASRGRSGRRRSGGGGRRQRAGHGSAAHRATPIAGPMDGIVVDVRRHAGEWLEPGKAVVRLVRDDRLRATGSSSSMISSPRLKARPRR